MVKRRKQVEISKDVWRGLKNLSKRYDAPMIEVADKIFDSSDLRLLDELFGKRRKLKKHI